MGKDRKSNIIVRFQTNQIYRYITTCAFFSMEISYHIMQLISKLCADDEGKRERMWLFFLISGII